MKSGIVLCLSALCVLLSGCREADSDKGYFIDQTIKVVDGITGTVRSGETIKLSFLENGGNEYSNLRTTDKNGIVSFKGSSNGTYSVEFSYFSSSSFDNQMEFSISDGEQGKQRLMTVNPPDEKPFAAPVIITGLMIDPAGWDQGKAGANVTWDPTTIVYQHDGSYEYAQFFALEDIDFSATPYSVVFANNGYTAGSLQRVTANGWAEGGYTTYKFDLTSGTAAKGTFFYVGGSAMRISGFVKQCSYFSEKIDNANWIRIKNYAVDDGDGLGTTKGNNYDMMNNGNVPSAGNNVPDGVAIFRGTTVTAESVPVDALFYGTAPAIPDAYDPSNGYGYQIPDNEFYSRTHPETGAAQPYFGQGTNTFKLRDVSHDNNVSEFIMLGGVFDTGKVYSPRGATYKNIPSCPGAASLSDIESGKGVSYILAPAE